MASSASSASPNPDWARNSDERRIAIDDRDARDVGALLDRARGPARGFLGHVELQVDGEVRRALPRVADGIGVVDGDAKPGRQRQRRGDDEDRQHARERLAGKALDGADEVVAVQAEVMSQGVHRRLALAARVAGDLPGDEAQRAMRELLDELEVVRGDQTA